MQVKVISVENVELDSDQMPTSRTPRKPGRPKGDDDLRDKILDEAGLAFAEAGFAGARTRDIAAGAGVNQGLIRYYFGSKEQLFEQVFRRYGGLISGNRHVLLDRLLAQPTPYSVEDVIRAYLQPQWDMKYSGPNGAAFVRLQARLHAEPENQALQLRREVYDASVKRYVDTLAPLLPHLGRDLLSLRMSFLIGTYMFMLNDLGRIEDLTEGSITGLGKDEMLDNLVAFLSAGLRAPAP